MIQLLMYLHVYSSVAAWCYRQIARIPHPPFVTKGKTPGLNEVINAPFKEGFLYFSQPHYASTHNNIILPIFLSNLYFESFLESSLSPHPWTMVHFFTFKWSGPMFETHVFNFFFTIRRTFELWVQICEAEKRKCCKWTFYWKLSWKSHTPGLTGKPRIYALQTYALLISFFPQFFWRILEYMQRKTGKVHSLHHTCPGITLPPSPGLAMLGQMNLIFSSQIRASNFI